MQALRENLRKAVLGLTIAGWSVAANAGIVWDYSPGTTGGTGETNYSNWWYNNGQNFVDKISFGANATLTGMDIYRGGSWGQVGDLAIIHIFNDTGGEPGAMFSTFTETVSVVDAEGAISGVSRMHVDFTNPVSLLANTTYWIGMSAAAAPYFFTQMGLQHNVPGDSSMWLMRGDTPQGSWNGLGDMAFRLSGTVGSVPEPASLTLLGLGLAGLGFVRRNGARTLPN